MSSTDINPIIDSKIRDLCDDDQKYKIIMELLRLEILWTDSTLDNEKEFKKEYPKLIDRFFPIESDDNE